MTDPAFTLDGFHVEFATLAATLADDRARGYPRMIEAGEIGAAEARHRLFVMRAIAEIWRAATEVATPNRKLAAVTRDQCLEELAHILSGIEQRLRRRPADRTLLHRLELLRAMRWWHAQYPERAHALNLAFMVRHDALQRQGGAGGARDAA